MPQPYTLFDRSGSLDALRAELGLSAHPDADRSLDASTIRLALVLLDMAAPDAEGRELTVTVQRAHPPAPTGPVALYANVHIHAVPVASSPKVAP